MSPKDTHEWISLLVEMNPQIAVDEEMLANKSYGRKSFFSAVFLSLHIRFTMGSSFEAVQL